MRSIFCCFALLFLLSAPTLPAAAQGNPPPTLWSDMPISQKVPIAQAAIYPEGYQLVETNGNSILVPFDYDRKNIYVMRFGVSPGNTAYFTNQGDYPALYLPQDGYLYNGTLPGTRWYPFPTTFHPSQPVFIGVTGAFGGFQKMGWYPGMYYYGGFWSSTPWMPGQHFSPTPGQVVVIGGTRFTNWRDFRNYWTSHPTDQNFGNYWKTHPTMHPIGSQHPVVTGGPPVEIGSPALPPIFVEPFVPSVPYNPGMPYDPGRQFTPGRWFVPGRQNNRPWRPYPIQRPVGVRRNPRPSGPPAGRPLMHPILRRR
jgi:hypothetical protein